MKKLPTEVLVVIKDFEASPELVFRAWTDPDLVRQWWGPENFSCPCCKIDFRVGGEYIFCMQSPGGENYWTKGVYREIITNEKIVVEDSYADADGNIKSPASVGLPGDWPTTLTITANFIGVRGKTKFILTHEGLPLEMIDSCQSGWSETLEKLAHVISR